MHDFPAHKGSQRRRGVSLHTLLVPGPTMAIQLAWTSWVLALSNNCIILVVIDRFMQRKHDDTTRTSVTSTKSQGLPHRNSSSTLSTRRIVSDRDTKSLQILEGKLQYHGEENSSVHHLPSPDGWCVVLSSQPLHQTGVANRWFVSDQKNWAKVCQWYRACTQ